MWVSVGKGWLQCFTVSRPVLHRGELSAISPLLWSETEIQEFNQSCHLEVSVCVLADVDGNKEWGGWWGKWALGFGREQWLGGQVTTKATEVASLTQVA